MSRVLDTLRDREFRYIRPWFYNHPLAIRCELGQGDGGAYWRTARRRAGALYDILFPGKPDVLFFDHYIQDYDADEAVSRRSLRIWLRWQRERLRFSLEAQRRFRHEVIRGLPFDGFDDPEDTARINRILCWPDSTWNPRRCLRRLVAREDGVRVHFVSEANECIFSIYDDRGCDIVFFDPEKFREYYPRLRPYFLEYDLEEMERRLQEL